MIRLFPIVILLLCYGCIAAQDIPGAKDHPLITRYPGSGITYYEEQRFIPYKIATGPETGYKRIEKWVGAEGKLTRICYKVTGTITLTEVYRNYLNAFSKNGFEILAQGMDEKRNVSKEVGGRSFLSTFYAANPFPVGKNINLLHGSATSAGSSYIAAKMRKQGAAVYIVVGGAQYKDDEKYFMVDILEETAMENDLVKINAAEMMQGIERNGKVALYGIFFDFDKADIKPESKPALDEISKLLSQNPALKLYVVGHTDMKGTLDYNMNLSQKRAEAVVNELVKTYGVSAGRLIAKGIGPLAPVATNRNEDGAKQNRRVELVEWK